MGETIQRFPCASCGAQLEFTPGTHLLTCPHCGHEEAIPASESEIRELDFHAFVERARLNVEQEQDQVLHCNACAAEFTLGPYSASDACPFCGATVVVPADPKARVAPESVLPFQIDERAGRDKYREWIKSRFWAPNALKSGAEAKSSIHPVYIPYWTYDSLTTTWYTGQRGVYYYVTETYTSNGETRTRQVRKTRWYPASGVVVVPFDHVLVLASSHVPEKYTHHMQDWNLQQLSPYQDGYLSGKQAMRYDVDLEQGFERAKDAMAGRIHSAICADIGGDTQRVSTQKTQYDRITFKHCLLPIYTGAYRFRGKIWRFFINGQTGFVAGEAPISPWKVAIAVLLGLFILAIIIFFMASGGEGG